MKELLIRLRDHLKTCRHISLGLCFEIKISYLFRNYEENALISYICSNRPKRGKHFRPECQNGLYYWPTGELAPRIAWLNDKIKHFKK